MNGRSWIRLRVSTHRLRCPRLGPQAHNLAVQATRALGSSSAMTFAAAAATSERLHLLGDALQRPLAKAESWPQWGEAMWQDSNTSDYVSLSALQVPRSRTSLTESFRVGGWGIGCDLCASLQARLTAEDLPEESKKWSRPTALGHEMGPKPDRQLEVLHYQAWGRETVAVPDCNH